MGFRAYLARQLGHPDGPFGRMLVRLLNRANASLNDAVLDALPLRPGGHLLELGFGGGSLLAASLRLQPDLKATGLDRSSEAVAVVAKRRHEEIEAGRLTLLEGQATDLPFPDGTFSAVAAVNVLYFWPDLEPVLAECRRVLAPGGRLVLGYTDATRLETMDGFHPRSPGTLEAILEETGFEDVTTSPVVGPPDCYVTSALLRS